MSHPASPLLALLAVAAGWSATLPAQVHYHDDGRPWKQRAHHGPDAEVDGWFYNLGITGIRVRLLAEAPKELQVEHVFADSPGSGRIAVGDRITGVAGEPFREAHQNGYGVDVFGARGPIGEFAAALEASQTAAGGGKLNVTIRRDDETREVTLGVGRRYGAFAASFPADCPKSARIRAELLAWLVANQKVDGSFGNPVHDTFAPLALLASGEARYRKAVERSVRYHVKTTSSKDSSWLINWRYMAAAIVLAEYHLATGAKWVLPELEQVHDFLTWSQYVDQAQINPKSKETHPHAYPKHALDSHGGWGHNPGFEGYGPICMLTAQGAVAFALMHECGIAVDRERHDAAYAFLARATGPNGYVWYEDAVGNPEGWADMGRTGAAAIASWLSPYPEGSYRERALAHARVIGEHPESFPDTHGSPPMGMAWTAAAAGLDDACFRALMDANRWWFALAQCCDGTFYYQPNRDNAGYGDDARMSASAVTAFILTIPDRSLRITGRR